jgi:hypothetical protein
MKKGIGIIFLAFLAFASCKNETKKDNTFAQAVSTDLSNEMEIPTKEGKVDTNNMAKITFDETVYDFGKIKEGDVVEHTFKFRNTGNRNLMLLYHKTTCGCTVPEFSKDPYKPGATGKIKVIFNSKGKKMAQNKKIKIFSNTYPNMTTLTMKGYVIPKG